MLTWWCIEGLAGPLWVVQVERPDRMTIRTASANIAMAMTLMAEEMAWSLGVHECQ